ncbi:MAG: hypothetical protein Q8L27_04865 [archaeon]|nr:hypothetical protein [archaeon]
MGCSGCYKQRGRAEIIPALKLPTKEDLEDFIEYSLLNGIGNPTEITQLPLYQEYLAKGKIREE